MEPSHDPLRKIQTKHAPETKADIGSQLKAARTKRGHTIDAVSQQTRIPKKWLEALEANRLEEFPALAYLRGFLKTYCDYLEVDFEALWNEIVPKNPPPADAAAKPAAAPTPAPKPAAAPAVHAAPKHEPKKAHASAHDAHGHGHAPAGPSSSPITGPAALVLVGILAAALGLFLKFSGGRHQAAVEQPATPAALQPLKTSVQAQFSLLFREDMWVSISVDGADSFEGRVPRGTKQDWTAKKTLVLRASDPQALKLTVNGNPATLPSPDSEGRFKIEAP